jgi:hypothetical protein
MKRCRPGFSLESQCESEFETLFQDVYVLIYCQAICVIIVENPMFVVRPMPGNNENLTWRKKMFFSAEDPRSVGE